VNSKEYTPLLIDPEKKILDFLSKQKSSVTLRKILTGIGSKDRVGIKLIIRKLEKRGNIEKSHGKKYFLSGKLAPVGIIEIIEIDEFGDLIAKPCNWKYQIPYPKIIIKFNKQRKSFNSILKYGDTILARLSLVSENTYNASVIKKLEQSKKSVIGIYEKTPNGGLLKPTDKKFRYEYTVTSDGQNGAKSGDLVLGEITSQKKFGKNIALISKIFNFNKAFKNQQPFSNIALHENEIPFTFNDTILEQVNNLGNFSNKLREDLRNIPLITIDDHDAKDFDDAVFAEPWKHEENSNGWHIIVAIADVAWYVREGMELDQEAFDRGNSVYFPDMVVPMLPEKLSNDLCSLKPNEDRPCLAVHIWIDGNGNMIEFKFIRGLMRSFARLNYQQVQMVIEGKADIEISKFSKDAIEPLFLAYKALCKAKNDRNPLDLELPEKRIILNNDGKISDVIQRPRYDSHKLIEEFMITANVAAATELEKKSKKFLYRIHAEPPAKNLESLRSFLKSLGYTLSKGQVLAPLNFNQILKKSKNSDVYEAITQMILRSQSQAVYSAENIGHFGLSLRRYCHFTSPIRRYSDLIVHRALISANSLGEGGFSKEDLDIESIAEHTSIAERRASKAERQSTDRFAAAYLSDKIGENFQGKVNGIAKFGLFISLDKIGIDGLIPIRSLSDDFYKFDERRMLLKGSRKGVTFSLGMCVKVKIKESNPISGTLLLELVDTYHRSKSPERRP
tara:strand:+ start:13890 stop:16085 length:2196 start_codon:yes stop_codon:yes gene_type:complete